MEPDKKRKGRKLIGYIEKEVLVEKEEMQILGDAENEDDARQAVTAAIGSA